MPYVTPIMQPHTLADITKIRGLIEDKDMKCQTGSYYSPQTRQSWGKRGCNKLNRSRRQ
jgi:hypothetical protein